MKFCDCSYTARVKPNLQVHNHDEDVVGGAGPRLDLRFLLPSALCGVLIGKSGSTIRQFGQV